MAVQLTGSGYGTAHSGDTYHGVQFGKAQMAKYDR